MVINDKIISSYILAETIESEEFYWIYKNEKWYVSNKKWYTLNRFNIQFEEYIYQGFKKPQDFPACGTFKYISIEKFEKINNIKLAKIIP